MVDAIDPPDFARWEAAREAEKVVSPGYTEVKGIKLGMSDADRERAIEEWASSLGKEMRALLVGQIAFVRGFFEGWNYTESGADAPIAPPSEHCTQCGKMYWERACGPTHAVIAAQKAGVPPTVLVTHSIKSNTPEALVCECGWTYMRAGDPDISGQLAQRAFTKHEMGEIA